MSPYKIKPLEWIDRSDGSMVAFASFGPIEITSTSGGYGVTVARIAYDSFDTQREAEAFASYEYEKIVRACIL